MAAGARLYDVDSAARRFLMLKKADDYARPTEIVIIEIWALIIARRLEAQEAK